MRKNRLFAVSLIAVMMGTAAHADIASTKYVDDAVSPVSTAAANAASAASTANTAATNAKKAADDAAAAAAAAQQTADNAVSGLAGKQNTLKQGANITIAADGTISATDTKYTLPAATATTLGGVMVDTELSTTSTNPVQNKAVNEAITAANNAATNAKTAADNAAAAAAAAQQTADGKQAKSSAAYQMGGANGTWTTMSTAQQNALNSGITSGKVSTYDGYATTIGNKQDKSTAVTHTAKTAVGDTAHPVYITADGVATRIDKVAAATTADKATQDGNGNNIVNTYATKNSVIPVPTETNATGTLVLTYNTTTNTYAWESIDRTYTAPANQ